MRTEELARLTRIHSIEMTSIAHESHIASALSCADILAVLYNDVLDIDPKRIDDPNRDIFILSKGHACVALYSVLAEKGFIKTDELKTFCADGSRLSGHVSKNVPGVELSTGSLGHGAGVAAGFALANKKDRKPNRVVCLVGDGECNEGSVWEMAWFAYHQKLGNLTVIIDHNKMQAMGSCDTVLNPISLASKWKSFGWNTIEINGHDCNEIKDTLLSINSDFPTCIIANTTKGKGVSFMENNLLWHYRDPQGHDYYQALEELGGKV